MFTVNLYSFFILLSFLFYAIVVYFLTRKLKISWDEYLTSFFFVFLFIFFGAKIVDGLMRGEMITSENFAEFGLSSVGGAIGALIGISLYILFFRKNKQKFLLLYMLPLPLVYGVAKLGCFFTGCCYGVFYNGLFSVTYYHSSFVNGVSLFPVQLLETILNIFLFVGLYVDFIRKYNCINTIGKTLFFVSIIKFMTDYLRASHQGIFLSMNQMICIFFLLIGGLIWIISKHMYFKE